MNIWTLNYDRESIREAQKQYNVLVTALYNTVYSYCTVQLYTLHVGQVMEQKDS